MLAHRRVQPLEVDVTDWARPLGLLCEVSLSPGLWALCQQAPAPLDAERAVRYFLTGLIRAIRRDGVEVSDVWLFPMVLREWRLNLVARREGRRIHLDGCLAG
ncbi:MAG: hypothetical protein VKP62_01905 [Candidatus Sericytochromatia bacterium]|nr:hypothetical protein [Candidatus Sericytochromatia bacterium]